MQLIRTWNISQSELPNVVHQCGYCDREEINNLIRIYIESKENKIMTQTKMKITSKSDIREYKEGIGENMYAQVYVSDKELKVEIDDAKFKKYKSFVTATDMETDEYVEMLGYVDTMTEDQVKEQFEILTKNAKGLKKANSLHRQELLDNTESTKR